jgi:AraC family transcriptional regulator
VSTSSERAVERAIGAMHDNLGEQVAIDDLARSAMFSKFHFSRMFRHIAGISPGRFLSALRIQEAKHQLLATSFNVADISVLVGYNSIGTFSTRFARSVGLAPSVFRRLDGFAPRIPTEVPAAPGAAVVRGRIHSFRPGGQSGPVFLGLFPDRIPEGRPARCAIIEEPGADRRD